MTIQKGQCPLGLVCTEMGWCDEVEWLAGRGDCLNDEECANLARPCDLYSIYLLKGLPGAIYVLWAYDNHREWFYQPEWGFRELCWGRELIWITARHNPFEPWLKFYEAWRSSGSQLAIRSEQALAFEELRCRVKPGYANWGKDLEADSEGFHHGSKFAI